MFLYPLLQPSITGIENLLVIECQVNHILYIVPVQFIIEDVQLMMLYVYEGTIGNRYNTPGGMPAHIPESMDLFKVHIRQAGTLFKYPVGRTVKILIFFHQVTKQRPFAF